MNKADDFQLRIILGKPSADRSYDDLLALRTRIAEFDLFKSTFAGLHPRQLDELCRSLGFETFDHGQVIFNQGDLGDKFYIVLSGSCSVKLKYTVEDPTSGDSEIREKLLFTCVAGQHFGERALEFSEPRAASVIAAAFSEIMTITKDAYTKILKAYQEESGLLKLDSDNKASIIRVLSKGREKRTEAELLAVSAYLERRNHFFQKFTADQRIELCRVSELISIYGRTTLFKQWQVGQAFYVILSGTVDVFVNSMDPSKIEEDEEPNAANLKTGVDGLLVNTLGPGSSFGERALDSETNQRTASVVTCDHMTELLVISREDYHAIVAVIMQEETAEKVKLLRSTLIFKDAPFPVLKEMAKYMEARTYHIDSFLLTSGCTASDMIIIAEGEALVGIDIDHYNNSMFNTTAPPTVCNTPSQGTPRVAKKGKSKVTSAYGQHIRVDSTVRREKLELGRVGPSAVLCTEITQLSGINEECFHPETVQATTIVSAFVVAKNDYYHHLAVDSRRQITELIRNYRPPNLATLWDCGAIEMGESRWRSQNTWKAFRKDVISGKKTANILYNHHKQKQYSLVSNEMNKRILLGPLDETQLPAYQKTKRDVDATNHLIVTKERAERRAIVDQLEAKEREDLKRFTPLNQKELKDAAHAREHSNTLSGLPAKTVSAVEEDGLVSAKVNKSVLLQGDTVVSSSYGHPFSLVHIHREKVKYRSGMGPRRMIKCYFRLCGITTSCSDAVKAAEAIMLNAFISMYNSDMERSSEVFLNWKQFLSFDSMPMHHTDHLIIYCRTAPMQYCSLSPSEDLLNFVFPAGCKLRGQRYAAISVNHLVDPTKPRKVLRSTKPGTSSPERNYDKKPEPVAAVTKSPESPKRGGAGKPGSPPSRPGMPEKAPSMLGMGQLTRRASMKNVKGRNSSMAMRGGGLFGAVGAAEDVDSDPDDGTDVAEADEEIEYPDKKELVGEPMLKKEVSVIGQVHRCSSSAIEAYRFAKFYSAKNIKPLQSLVNDLAVEPDHLRMCILPMYSWIEVSEEVLSHFDRDRMTEANVEENILNIPKNVNLAANKHREQAVKAQLSTAFGQVGLTNFGRHGLKDEKEVSVLEPEDKKLTEMKSISVLNEEVDRKRLFDEITSCAAAALQGNDQTYVGSLNNAMYLLHEVHPHVVPIEKAHQIHAQHLSAVKEAHRDTHSPINHGHHGEMHAHPMAMLHKQVSFSGFTDSILEVRTPSPASTRATSPAPVDLLGVPVKKEALTPFSLQPGIATQAKVSIFQVKGALVKQRNHEIQEAAVAAIRESELKIVDRMDALRRTTEERANIIALHDGICSQEKEIADLLKAKAKPAKQQKASPKRTRANLLAKQLSSVIHHDHHTESEDEGVQSRVRSRTSTMAETVGTYASSDSDTDTDFDDDEAGSSVAQLPVIKKLGTIPAMQRRSSSAMIIAAMSNVSTATMADSAPQRGGGLGRQADDTETDRFANRKFRRQMVKSKTKVISDRMDLLEGLIKLPSTKAVETDIRQKRWVKTHSASESKLKHQPHPQHQHHQNQSGGHKAGGFSSSTSGGTGAGGMSGSKSTPSLSLKLDVLETMLNKRNGISMVAPSTVEDLGFAENVIPISAEVRDYSYEHKTSVFDKGE